MGNCIKLEGNSRWLAEGLWRFTSTDSHRKSLGYIASYRTEHDTALVATDGAALAAAAIPDGHMVLPKGRHLWKLVPDGLTGDDWLIEDEEAVTGWPPHIAPMVALGTLPEPVTGVELVPPPPGGECVSMLALRVALGLGVVVKDKYLEAANALDIESVYLAADGGPLRGEADNEGMRIVYMVMPLATQGNPISVCEAARGARGCPAFASLRGPVGPNYAIIDEIVRTLEVIEGGKAPEAAAGKEGTK